MSFWSSVHVCLSVATLLGSPQLPAQPAGRSAQQEAHDRAVVLQQLQSPPSEATGEARKIWDAFLARIASSASWSIEDIRLAAFNDSPAVRRNAAATLALLARGKTLEGDELPRIERRFLQRGFEGLLWHDDAGIRIAAAQGIAMVGIEEPRGLYFLGALALDPDVNVRIAAASAMGALGPAARDLLPLVQRLVQDAKTRAAGQLAFERISGSKRGAAPPGGMLLLPGYTHVREQGVDTAVGRIVRKGGPHIGYDIGGMAGDKAAEYAERGPLWTKLQVMNGHIVRVTMVSGGQLFATFQDDSANFEASSVRTPEDLADVLLMVATYKPSRR